MGYRPRTQFVVAAVGLLLFGAIAVAWVLLVRPEPVTTEGAPLPFDTMRARTIPYVEEVPGELDTLADLPIPPVAAPPALPPSEMPQDTAAPSSSIDTAVVMPEKKLIIPVQGVKESELIDTYNEARSEGRVHNAIDIIAPRGTPVLAATSGRIVKLFQSEKGGITLYQLDPDGQTVYYYAHLDRYADGIQEGKEVRQGEVIGYVGDTGNAGPGNYHLHFGISVTDETGKYWGGTDVNPYPLLRSED